MSTAWMIRNDGTAFPCECHTYGNWDVQVVEETLAAAQWLYEHTAKSAVRELCMEFISAHAGELKAPAFAFSMESLNEDLNLELNQEFLRARYRGLYDTDPVSREMFFMNPERIKQFVRRCSWKEQDLTADEGDLGGVS